MTPNNLWMALIALAEDELPVADDVLGFLKDKWPDLPPPTRLKRTENGVTFEIGESSATWALIDRPIPWRQLEGPCATAWYWPEAESTLRQQCCHIFVTLLNEGQDRIAASMLLSQLVAAIAAETRSLGIYWGPGRLVHDTSAFLDLVLPMTTEYLPLYLWIDFRIEKADDGSNLLYTTGMEPLGHRELEVALYPDEPQSLIDHVYNVAHYQLDRGHVVHDGDTIGLADGLQATVRFTQSMWDADKEVASLEF